MMVQATHTLIIGASFSGLACAAALQKNYIEYILLEKQDQVATPWRNHYHRLHLHTNKRLSHLPYRKFGPTIPRYPGRQQVIDYLEDYQRAFDIRPVFATEALSIQRKGEFWITETNKGVFRCSCLIMATGAYGRPRRIDLAGVGSFPGRVLHSCEYKTGVDLCGQRVLVVGFGNSACEIAIDLYEQGARPAMAVRSPVNIIPRDVWGVPVLELSLLLNRLSPRVADAISAPLMNWLIGDISRLGLKKKSYGPLEQIRQEGKAPVLDIGTLSHIREGHIQIYAGIDRIEDRAVHFTDGRMADFDVLIAAIGYERSDGIVDVGKERFEDLRVPVDKQKYFGKEGLYFCGYWISPTGQIREISADAQKIAWHIAGKKR
jgi:hypothetical protein